MRRYCGLRIWEKGIYRFCANDHKCLQSLYLTYTMYNKKTKIFSLILTYTLNCDPKLIYEPLEYRKPTINKTPYLTDDKLFYKCDKLNNLKIKNPGGSVIYYDNPHKLLDKNEYIELRRKYDGLKITESVFNRLCKLHSEKRYPQIINVGKYRLARYLPDDIYYIYDKEQNKIGVLQYYSKKIVSRKVEPGDYVVATKFITDDKKCDDLIKQELLYRKYMSIIGYYEKELRR